jgi:hypothetical protein
VTEKTEANQQQAVKVVGKWIRGDREVWRVDTGGQIRNIATRSSSTHAMDEAVVLYGNALKRLANR